MTKKPYLTLVFAALLLICPLTEAADFNENIRILDPAPEISLENTGGPGREWSIRGWNTSFVIRDESANTSVLSSIPSSSSVSLGYYSDPSGWHSIALGRAAESLGSESVALGFSADAIGNESIAIGDQAAADGNRGVALGWSTDASGNWSSALGYNSSTSGLRATALGSPASVQSTEGLALGAVTVVTSAASRSVALGYGAYVEQPNTIVMGAIPGINDAGGFSPHEYANVGIGTNTPVQAVDVERSAAAARFQLTSFTNTANEAPQYIQRRARGTKFSPSAVLNNDNLGLFSFRGYNGSVMGGSRATITAQAAGNFTNSSTPTRLIFATTPVGQTTPQPVLVITPDGKVRVNGQNLNVPDYVFEDDYELMPLDELRAFIDANGHLPGIASAEEVKAGSLDLVDTPLGNLRKIEELTLYTLQQQSELDAVRQLRQENQELVKRVAQLERLVETLLPLAQRE